jgi:hypothetical protein
LQRVLPGISTEQLRSRLNRMVADGMLTRKRYREVPPRVDYELTNRSRELMPILGALARWGYEWAWGPPRTGEAIDVGAIFRLAPGLITPSAQMQGTVEVTVDDTQTGGKAASYSFALSGEAIAVREEHAEQADARISASTAAWIAAFSPQHDRSGLDIRGQSSLAGALLDALATAPAHAAAHSSAVA